MLNIPDFWVLAAFVLSIGSSALCVYWGISRWNKSDRSDTPVEELTQWIAEESNVKK